MSGPESARSARIRERLEAALGPLQLDIEDQSHLHAGHPGARDGRGHFAIRIAAPALRNLTPLEQHRRVYAALGDLMETDIHAVSLDIETTDAAT